MYTSISLSLYIYIYIHDTYVLYVCTYVLYVWSYVWLLLLGPAVSFGCDGSLLRDVGSCPRRPSDVTSSLPHSIVVSVSLIGLARLIAVALSSHVNTTTTTTPATNNHTTNTSHHHNHNPKHNNHNHIVGVWPSSWLVLALGVLLLLSSPMSLLWAPTRHGRVPAEFTTTLFQVKGRGSL